MKRVGVILASFTAAIFAVAALPDGGHGELKAPSKYRQVTNNVGNCIFSTGMLEFKKDDTFKDIRTEFKTPEEVHVRCYYPKLIREYEAQGKLSNSIRNEKKAIFTLQIKTHAGGEAKRYQIRGKLPNLESDQGRFDLVQDPKGCDWKYPPGFTECVDIQRDLKKVAEELKQSLPYTGEVCVATTFDYVDQKVWGPVVGGSAWKDDVRHGLISESCFKYTVR